MPDAAPPIFREVLRIAGPTVATMTSYTMMTFTDKWLVSKIGPEPVYVGAQGNGGLASWVAISFASGTLTIINTFVAQNMGAGRPERGAAFAWNGVWLGLLYWLVILMPYSFALPWLLRIANLDPEQARLGAQYGQILLWGAGITLVTRSMSQFFFGMHRARVVMVAGIAANLVNLGLSYLLIFGTFGFPTWGVAGSAVATVIASGVELAILMWVFLGKEFAVKFGTRLHWRPSWAHCKDIARLGWPGGAMFGNEMICWGFFMVYLVSHFGRVHSTAGWIAHQYMSLSFMPAVGLSVACTALVGKYQGMGRPDLAEQRAWYCTRVAMVYMGVCALAFVVFRRPLIGLFIPADALPEDVGPLVALGSSFLIAAAAFQLFDAVAMVLSGALRGAGDTFWPGMYTLVLSWGVIVLGGLGMITFVPRLGSVGPWIAAAAYIVILCMMLLARFRTGHWKKIRIVKDPVVTAAAGEATDGVQ